MWGVTRAHVPFVGTEDAWGKGGHQVISQTQNHNSAGQPSQHRRVKVVDQSVREEERKFYPHTVYLVMNDQVYDLQVSGLQGACRSDLQAVDHNCSVILTGRARWCFPPAQRETRASPSAGTDPQLR